MKRLLMGFLLVFALLTPFFGADIKIPSLEIATSVSQYDGETVVTTDMGMDILIEGGYKFGGKVVVGFEGSLGLPTIQTLPPLTFKAINLLVRDIFGSGLEFSYFIGINDFVCYGDDFTRLYGAPFIQSNYNSQYLYYLIPSLPPIPFFKTFRGLHRINGNGIKLSYTAPDQPIGFAWYFYQDHNFVASMPLITIGPPPIPIVNINMLFYDTGIYSSDLRLLVNTEPFKLEAYAGGTIDSKNLATGWARFGGMLYFGLGPVDFLLAAGLPYVDFVSPFYLDNLYALFESRLDMGPITLIPTVFFHPNRYLQMPLTNEENKIDFNLKLSVFSPRRDFISFGAEGNFATRDLLFSAAPGYELRVLPFIALATPGVYWEIKVSMLLVDSDGALTTESFLSSIQGFINLKAEF